MKTEHTPNPEHILQIGFGFWASKTLLSAVELDLFTHLDEHPGTAEEIGEALGLHPRSREDFLDALVALHIIDREGNGPSAQYRNTPDSALFLSKRSPAYLGGILEMANARLYRHWGSLTEGLQTGEPQNEIKTGAPGLFEGLYSDRAKLENFLGGMQGLQLGAFTALCNLIDFSRHTSFCDLGGANGTLAILLAQKNPHLTGVVFDLPPVVPVAQANLERAGVASRVSATAGDFFADEYPQADVYFMGNILHDWSDDEKRGLIKKAYDALPSGGMFIAIENVIDDERRENVFGLLMSLNMMIEAPAGRDYTGAQFDEWARSAGFARTEIRRLAGPTSAAIAYKA